MEPLGELAAILAAGYARLMAKTRAVADSRHQTPHNSDLSALYGLDTPRPQSDESCADQAATHSPGRGYA